MENISKSADRLPCESRANVAVARSLLHTALSHFGDVPGYYYYLHPFHDIRHSVSSALLLNEALFINLLVIAKFYKKGVVTREYSS